MRFAVWVQTGGLCSSTSLVATYGCHVAASVVIDALPVSEKDTRRLTSHTDRTEAASVGKRRARS